MLLMVYKYLKKHWKIIDIFVNKKHNIMAKKIDIEAEGGEIILQNDNGDTVIIPKASRTRVLKMIDDEDNEGIDTFVNTLPSMADYAEGGSLIPDSFPVDPPATVSNSYQEETEIDWNRISTTTPLGSETVPGQGLGTATQPPMPELYWRNSPGALSKYKMLMDEGKSEEASSVVFGHYDPSKTATPYQSGTHGESEKKGLIKSIRASDLGTLNENYSKMIPDYGALQEGVGRYTNQKAEGGLIKAEAGLTIPKETDSPGKKLSKKERVKAYSEAEMINLAKSMETLHGTPTVKTKLNIPEVSKIDNTLEKLHPSIKEYGEGPADIPEGYYIKTQDFQNQLSEWREDFTDWETNVQSLDPEAAYNRKSPYPGKHGCTGSGCRVPIGDMPSYYDIRQKAGIYSVQTGDREEFGSGYEQIDAWEFASAAEAAGIGKNWMRPGKSLKEFTDVDAEYGESDYAEHLDKVRTKTAANFENIPIGSYLNTGDAEGAYIDEGAKTFINIKGKKQEITQESKPRHTIRYRGVDPDTGDYLFYNFGKLDRVKTDGSMEKSDVVSNIEGTFKDMEDYLKQRDVRFITSLTEQGDVSKKELEKRRKHNRAIN